MMTGSLPAAESAEARYDPRLYVRISRDLREKLAAGVIAAGDAVRVTSLMQEWSTSRQTVRKALHVLEAEGLIRRYPGVGYFVPSRTDTGQATCRNGSAS
jgi:DNA-binding GntR family transcriptional regulator